jgi:transcriptional regulator with XRE-family HTH domain
MKKKTLGQLIKQQRDAYDLTQRELASKLGVKASHIAYLENGRRKPSLALLRRIADTLGLDEQQLFLLAHPTVAGNCGARSGARGRSRCGMAAILERSCAAGSQPSHAARIESAAAGKSAGPRKCPAPVPVYPQFDSPGGRRRGIGPRRAPQAAAIAISSRSRRLAVRAQRRVG